MMGSGSEFVRESRSQSQSQAVTGSSLSVGMNDDIDE